MLWVGRDLWRSSDMFNWVRLLRAQSNLALNVSRDGASTASLGNRFQCSNTPSIKNFFLTASLMASSLLLNLLLTPAPERVAWTVWLLLGECTLLTLSAGLEDMQGGREASPAWGAEWEGAVGGGNPFRRSFLCLCRPGNWWGTLVSLN